MIIQTKNLRKSYVTGTQSVDAIKGINLDIEKNEFISIMGPSGSGKTTLAEKLVPKLNAAWFNADAIRQDIYSELGFTPEDRIEHSKRMGKLCHWASMNGGYAVADFICPTEKAREAFDADFIIWVNS